MLETPNFKHTHTHTHTYTHTHQLENSFDDRSQHPRKKTKKTQFQKNNNEQKNTSFTKLTWCTPSKMDLDNVCSRRLHAAVAIMLSLFSLLSSLLSALINSRLPSANPLTLPSLPFPYVSRLLYLTLGLSFEELINLSISIHMDSQSQLINQSANVMTQHHQTTDNELYALPCSLRPPP